MTKRKVSATVDRERLAEATELTGVDSVSGVLDRALEALIERELERRWLDAHHGPVPDDDLPGEVAPDLTDVPFEP